MHVQYIDMHATHRFNKVFVEVSKVNYRVTRYPCDHAKGGAKAMLLGCWKKESVHLRQCFTAKVYTVKS